MHKMQENNIDSLFLPFCCCCFDTHHFLMMLISYTVFSASILQLFNISTTVDPSYIISLIRKLLPRDVKNGHDSDGVDACNASNQGLKTNHMKESVVSPCEDEMLNSSHDKIETMDTLDGFDELARQEKTGEVSCSRFEDSSISVREKAWEEYGCILWDLAASRIHAEFMVIEFIAFYLLSFGVAHCLFGFFVLFFSFFFVSSLLSFFLYSTFSFNILFLLWHAKDVKFILHLIKGP